MAATSVPAYRKICESPAPATMVPPSWRRTSSSTSWPDSACCACPTCAWPSRVMVTRQSSPSVTAPTLTHLRQTELGAILGAKVDRSLLRPPGAGHLDWQGEDLAGAWLR